MKISGVELRRLTMPLRSPFETSFGVATERDILLVRVATEEADGWGECVAMNDPLYSAEYTQGAHDVITRYFLPKLAAAPRVTAPLVAEILAPFKGHPIAKAALEAAVLDAELRAAGTSFGDHLGAVRTSVPVGVSVGIMPTVAELVDVVGGYLDQGYRRVKLKIKPGWDVEPVRAVRERFGDALLLQVDANTAYTLGDAQRLAALDPFDLLLIEQPLPEDDLRGHAALSGLVRTPICLDESIVSARSAADAIALGACRIVNVKPARVGGYLEARRVHDVCAAHGRAGLVRRHAGDRHRPRGERRPGGVAELHPPRRHSAHQSATSPVTSPSRSSCATAAWTCPRAPASGLRRIRRCSTSSPPPSTGSTSLKGTDS